MRLMDDAHRMLGTQLDETMKRKLRETFWLAWDATAEDVEGP